MSNEIKFTAASRREVKAMATQARRAVSTGCTFSSPKKEGSHWAVKVTGPENLLWQIRKAAKKK